jgi:hypothetical protein
MFFLTFVVAAVLGTVVVGRNQQVLDSLGWGGIVLAICPIVIVWILDRRERYPPHALVISSSLLYGLSMFLLAFRLGADRWYGDKAFAASFLGLLVLPQLDIEDLSWWIALPMGAAANIAYIVGLLAVLFTDYVSTLMRKIAKWGAILGAGSIVPLAIASPVQSIYPGYGIWVAGLLALWLGTRRLE